ncbi:MAG: isocitrate lyase/phosphoenolpyruvate mutase family protein [Bradyrhizobiaceae bacterium]|nr:isocitrate lyase/phosphoenolpyruvate mutase family protein [Bradyrhizobiaceae bacterium]
MPSLAAKRREFRRLHETGCLVLPNPWDVGTARYLQGLGFKALATTSAGAAFAMGFADNEMPVDAMLHHIHEIVKAVNVPVSADFGNCFAHDAKGVGANVRAAIETGVAGLSIEDSTGRKEKPLYDLPHAVERVRAARSAVDHSATGVVLTARAENFLVGQPDLDDAIHRVTAYAEAGADCLYVPGIRTREQIVAVVKAVAPKPVNVLVGHASEFTVADLAGMGVRRISTGSGLARAAWGGFMKAAQALASGGRFDGFVNLAPNADLNKFFHDDQARRGKA